MCVCVCGRGVSQLGFQLLVLSMKEQATPHTHTHTRQEEPRGAVTFRGSLLTQFQDSDLGQEESRENVPGRRPAGANRRLLQEPRPGDRVTCEWSGPLTVGGTKEQEN